MLCVCLTANSSARRYPWWLWWHAGVGVFRLLQPFKIRRLFCNLYRQYITEWRP